MVEPQGQQKKDRMGATNHLYRKSTSGQNSTFVLFKIKHGIKK